MATKTIAVKAQSRAKPALKAKNAVARAFSAHGKNADYVGELTRLRRTLGISQKVFAQLCSSSQRAVARWEAGEKPGDLATRTLIELQRLQRALAQVMRRDFIPQWLEAPNKAFRGLRPIEVIERGEVDRIWSLIHYLKSGEPS